MLRLMFHAGQEALDVHDLGPPLDSLSKLGPAVRDRLRNLSTVLFSPSAFIVDQPLLVTKVSLPVRLFQLCSKV